MPDIAVAQANGSVATDPDGHSIAGRTRLLPAAAGGVPVAGGTTNTLITAISNYSFAQGNVGRMTKLRAVCTAVPTADGSITLKNNTAGTVLLIIPALDTYIKGQVLDFTFDVPLQTVAEAGFYIDAPANTGTWMYFANGYVINPTILF